MPYLILIGRNFAVWPQTLSLSPLWYPPPPPNFWHTWPLHLRTAVLLLLLRVTLTHRLKHSLFCSALNVVSSIPQALHAQQTNGLCACLLLSWPQEFSTPPLRFTYLGLEHSTLNRGFQTPLPTASTFRGWSVVSSALRAPRLLLVCLLPMTWR